MPAPNLLLALAFIAAADAADDEARIEQLLHRPVAAAPAPARATRPAHAATQPDPGAALLGHKVHVRTIDGGLYAGTLRASDAASITLRIDLQKQALDYTLPRGGVAGIESAEPAP